MLQLVITPPQLLLIFVYIFFGILLKTSLTTYSKIRFPAGLQRAFWSGVYGTSLANTLAFTSHKELLALHGIFVGVGGTLGSYKKVLSLSLIYIIVQLSGGGIFAIFDKQINRFGYIPVTFMGFFSNMLACALIFINIPFEATIQATKSTSYITSKQLIILFFDFFLGLKMFSFQSMSGIVLQLFTRICIRMLANSSIKSFECVTNKDIDTNILYIFATDHFCLKHKLYEG